jgi:hypothetical protein
MSDTPSLPPLPEPKTSAKELVGIGECDFYTADQMLSHREEYAKPLVEALREMLEGDDEDIRNAHGEPLLARVEALLSLYSKD